MECMGSPLRAYKAKQWLNKNRTENLQILILVVNVDSIVRWVRASQSQSR